MSINDFTQESLKALVHYDPDTGAFKNRQTGNDLHGTVFRGYLFLNIKQTKYKAHQVAWLYMTGEVAKGHIDHINGIGTDNSFSNLRLATYSQNGANRRMQVNSTGAKGVYRCGGGKFKAAIGVRGKQVHLGRHETVDEAAHAYNKAAIKYFGEFACLNPIGVDK